MTAEAMNAARERGHKALAGVSEGWRRSHYGERLDFHHAWGRLALRLDDGTSAAHHANRLSAAVGDAEALAGAQ